MINEYRIKIIDKVFEYLKCKEWFEEYNRKRLLGNRPMDIRDWLIYEDEHNELMNIISNAFPWDSNEIDYWKEIEDKYKKWLLKNNLIMPQVIMTNEEYYTLNEIYHFLKRIRTVSDRYSTDCDVELLPEEMEKLDRYIDTLESIAGDDEDEIIP